MQQMLITEQRLAKLWSQVGGSVAEPESNAGVLTFRNLHHVR